MNPPPARPFPGAAMDLTPPKTHSRGPQRLARVVSVAGHPALLTSAVGLAALAARGAPPRTMSAALALVLAIALGVVGYGLLQVRRGAWAHVDASDPAERRSHNRLGLAALAVGAAAALLAGLPAVAAALAAGALIMLAAWALARRLKLSQHVAFAALSAVLAASIHPSAAAVVVVMLALIAWSRLELRRHHAAEVAVGAAVGFTAGLLLLFAAPPMAA